MLRVPQILSFYSFDKLYGKLYSSLNFKITNWYFFAPDSAVIIWVRQRFKYRSSLNTRVHKNYSVTVFSIYIDKCTRLIEREYKSIIPEIWGDRLLPISAPGDPVYGRLSSPSRNALTSSAFCRWRPCPWNGQRTVGWHHPSLKLHWSEITV